MAWLWCGSAIFALIFSAICVVSDQGWRSGLQFLVNGLWFLVDVVQAVIVVLALLG
jgi:hypothetical protein